MKTILHKASERGYVNHGWLKSYHSFSFASYYDPSKIHFGMLRVLNDDFIAPGMGFGTHPHENMEIITIPLSGTLEHKDSMGHKKKLSAGEVQIMSAGTGIQHSEYNHSASDPVTLLQIWVFPKVKNIEPRYDQKYFELSDTFTTLVSPEKEGTSLWINQDAYFSIADLAHPGSIRYDLKKPGNGAYVFIIEGSAIINGIELDKRDAAGISETDIITLNAREKTKILVIEIPMN